ncbi:TetR family transcriptional regulator [Acetobacter estunensis]|uniref:TetR family transcriptional regulator n=1 Tax=Acetobacter estunensis TaxID=104097 RepID=UPI001C2CE931|nr:TetR family transcriptional regulator [Acetobacter estunensis]MBV1838104.1 TetR/AcrR family transcriptional regulator [Acetobacter estunensis]
MPISSASALSQRPRSASETAPPTRREAKREQTRKALIEAAMRLLSEKGFDETTVDEIAAAAGISRRTLFRHFPTKADLVTAWTWQMTDVLTETVNSCPLHFSLQEMVSVALEAVVPHMAPTKKEAFAFVCLIERTPALLSVSLQKYAKWEDSLAEALERRLPPTTDGTLAARVTARSAIAAFRTAVDEWIRVKGRAGLVPLLRRVLNLQAACFQPQHTD